MQTWTDREDHPATYFVWSQSETRLQNTVQTWAVLHDNTQTIDTGAKIPYQHSSHSHYQYQGSQFSKAITGQNLW